MTHYFQDIPQLIETIVSENLQRIIDENPTIDSVNSLLDNIIGFAFENKKAFLHIYNSTNRNIFEQYQWRTCERAVSIYIDSLLKGHKISNSDKQSIIDYLTCVTFGLAIGWLEKGLSDDFVSSFKRVFNLKQDDFESVIARFEKE